MHIHKGSICHVVCDTLKTFHRQNSAQWLQVEGYTECNKLHHLLSVEHEQRVTINIYSVPYQYYDSQTV